MAATTTDLLERIGSNLRAERVRRHLTQEAVARRSGMGVTQVARMERGETDSGISKYLRVAAAIGIEPTELLHGIRLDLEWHD
ncbi:helix-turn-helix transcriptional regulator [Nocardioides sp.]|jgi:transcriptional regulator with XRE-family HTH domain|uniref:helix-turn-helix domain-containing protein n=1 Tax=Nocardioides sp. TaxID=35761 RepID=UPI002C1D3D6D|nr:helix-turn-helix transcriptional regulator [Nocardioides sp.]HVX54705.1 helix-turn-helix transcriptional regulator [Nocardioides sp.]